MPQQVDLLCSQTFKGVDKACQDTVYFRMRTVLLHRQLMIEWLGGAGYSWAHLILEIRRLPEGWRNK